MFGGSSAEEKEYPSHAGRLPWVPKSPGFIGDGRNRTEAMERTDPIIDYRLRVILTGLIVSWFGLIVLAIWAVTSDAY